MGMPEVAYTNLAQVLGSYSITLLGCNFRCIYCNAYRLSQYPNTDWFYRGYVDAKDLAKEAVEKMSENGIQRMSFTGGEPTIHLPYIEEVVKEAKKMMPQLKVGFATNGFATKESMKRITKISSFITLEIKAFKEETHRALTGAPVEPVLRNAEYLIKNAPHKIRTFRSVMIPKINDVEMENIAAFIASINPSIPFRLIGFRPNFMLYYHQGPSKRDMEEIAKGCREKGLENVSWSGYYPQEIGFSESGAALAMKYAHLAGCVSKEKERNCGRCSKRKECPAVLKEPWLRKGA
jgi:pyruvate formate lyase activating enzyme